MPLATLHAADAPPPKRNVVVLLADDLRPDCLSMFGHPIVKTPNLDKLLANGFAFRNAYVLGSNSAAVCIPSRVMIQVSNMPYRPVVERVDFHRDTFPEKRQGRRPKAPPLP